jgi:AcrR family transcriptional regulator
MTSNVGSRRDRSEAVRESIRAAATMLFEESGFEATGVRDIALAAGVNPAIVIRHFGSKERLFVEAVNRKDSWLANFEGPIEELGYRIVRHLVMARDTDGLRVVAASIHSSGRAEVRDHLRESFAHRLTQRVMDRLDGTGVEDVEIRAHLFAAQLVGLITAMAAFEDPFLLRAPIEDLVSWYGGSLQTMLTGPHP